MADVAIALLHKSANWWSDLVLFIAGLSILIDLFEPDALRRLGMRARERALEARNLRIGRRRIRKLIYVRQDLLSSFLEVHPARYLPGGPRLRLRSEPFSYTPWKEELTREEYLAFWKRINNRLPSLHAKCNGGHGDICPNQGEYIVTQVDKFMRRRIGAVASEAVQAKHNGVYAGLKLRWLPVPFLMIVTWSVHGEVDFDPTILNALRVAYWIVLSISLFVFLVKVFPGLLSASLWSVAGKVLNWSGSLLDRKRPLHPFRIAAVALYVAGNLIKLLVGK